MKRRAALIPSHRPTQEYVERGIYTILSVHSPCHFIFEKTDRAFILHPF
jgi:hypothetical protein